jgi:hypothetical protein
MKYWILMADIVSSRKHDAAALMKGFKKITGFLNVHFSKKMISPLTITLGDEFQGIVQSLDDAIEIIFKSEEIILLEQINIKIRYSVNYGSIGTKINKKIAYTMLGPGLTEARDSLNEMKKSDARFKILTHGNNEIALGKSFLLYQSIVDSWKQKDLKVVSAFLENDDYQYVSKKIGKAPSTTWRRKKSLKIQAYRDAKTIIKYIAAN